MEIIAKIHTDFKTKYGVPRQAGLIEELKGQIIFEPKYRQPEAIRGLEEFSHIWVIWDFSMAHRQEWSATVKPPRLGGDVHMGVFATRSPHRPNPIGLSSLKLDGIEFDEKKGPILNVSGVDMMDGTPIFDIKPYVPFTDCHDGATAGWAEDVFDHELEVEFSEELLQKLPEDKREACVCVLKQDPRNSSHRDEPGYVHKMFFAGVDVHFKVDGKDLQVVDVID